MKLQQGSAYKVDRTAQNLFGAMDEYFHIPEGAVKKKLRACGYDKFKAVQWEEYIKCLTGHPACPYCGAPTVRDDTAFRGKRFPPLICIQDTTHYFMEHTESLRALQFINQAESLEEAATALIKSREISLTECKHNNLYMACDICMNELQSKRLDFSKLEE